MSIAALAALVLTSCSNDTEGISETANSANLVSFRAISDKTETKATPTDVGNFSNFTVNASATNVPNPATFNFMSALPVTRGVGTSGVWSYAPAKYWPTSGSVNFFAYSPAGSRNITALTPSGATSTIEYTVPLTYSVNKPTQEDFIVATNSASSGSVTLAFGHALSMVSFQATNAMSAMTVVVKGISLVNLDNTGTLTLDATGASYAWSNNTTFDQKYEASLPVAGVSLAPNTTSPQLLTSANEGLMILPQKPTGATITDPTAMPSGGGSYVVVSYSTIDNWGTIVNGLTKYFTLKQSLDKGNRYIFQFGFKEKEAVSFSIGLGGWADVDPATIL